jgi:hypothetical protein
VIARGARFVGMVLAIGAVLVGCWWALEMTLLAVSRYRLRHGDGREHTFRRR